MGALLSLFFPRSCAACGAALQEGEDAVCMSCLCALSRTGLHLEKDNCVERLFWARIPLVRATSFMYYHKGSGSSRLLHLLKYGGRKDLGVFLGRLMAAELQDSGFFNGVDALIPLPLHPRKQRSRGYNQSECLARGLSDVTGIPVLTGCVKRLKDTETQTHKSVSARLENVRGVFALSDAGMLQGKHVLLVDDVLTTGATSVACADALRQAEGIRISVLTLALADT